LVPDKRNYSVPDGLHQIKEDIMAKDVKDTTEDVVATEPAPVAAAKEEKKEGTELQCVFVSDGVYKYV
jgi:predicted NUDIX family NTP pyrophosphohydrolase